MRCPRCGSVLEATADGLSCRQGGMELSRYLERELARWLAADAAEGPGVPAGWGGQWHCPGDGTRMRESDGCFACPECERRLPRRLGYMLIELHSHGPAVAPRHTPAPAPDPHT